MLPDRQLELLRQYEPVIRYTHGESFFPMDVGSYVGDASLWVQVPGQPPVQLASQGQLDLEKLAQMPVTGPSEIQYLKFIEPLELREMIAYTQEQIKQRKLSKRFDAGLGRLARVGFISRVLDLLFSLTLVLRGRVRGDTSAAAAREYERVSNTQPHPIYYGRVIHQDGWIVLQYWFFYAFNNWRSGFFGVNDHEADWEMIHIYLYESKDGKLKPEWVAYALHEESGDSIRRHWEDPDLEKAGDHPVIYAGAGSHASYFSPGEHLAELEVPVFAPVSRLLRQLAAWWNRFSAQKNTSPNPLQLQEVFALRVPFIDYARGDGVAIGPGQQIGWGEPVLLDPIPGWVQSYRGLWGLYTQDPFSGENAPAGPMYNRDGSVRRAWHDPTGWAGMDKIPPPSLVLEHLVHRKAALAETTGELAELADIRSQELAGLSIEVTALSRQPHLKQLWIDQRRRLQKDSQALGDLRAQLSQQRSELEALQSLEDQLRSGSKPLTPYPRVRPAREPEMRINRLVELWSAVSIGILMIGFVALMIFYRQHFIAGLVVLISMFIFLESGFRRQLPQLINSLTIGLAVVAMLVLIWKFFWYLAVAAVLAAGGYIIWENLRELYAARQR